MFGGFEDVMDLIWTYPLMSACVVYGRWPGETRAVSVRRLPLRTATPTQK